MEKSNKENLIEFSKLILEDVKGILYAIYQSVFTGEDMEDNVFFSPHAKMMEEEQRFGYSIIEQYLPKVEETVKIIESYLSDEECGLFLTIINNQAYKNIVQIKNDSMKVIMESAQKGLQSEILALAELKNVDKDMLN